MERVIADFLNTDSGSGWGTGSGWGDCGSGGSGWGWGSGDGDGWGWGWGSGRDGGSDWGRGSGGGRASGGGSGDGGGGRLIYLKSFCGHEIYHIDNVPTLIDQVRGNIARGKILNNDFTCAPCYVVKHGNYFAHGYTLREARESVLAKAFQDMPLEERINAFVEAHNENEAYPNTDFFKWHNKLTGSCLMGREAFVKNHGIDMQGRMTVNEFIRLTENDYGGDVIRQLKERYKEED